MLFSYPFFGRGYSVILAYTSLLFGSAWHLLFYGFVVEEGIDDSLCVGFELLATTGKTERSLLDLGQLYGN